MPRSLAVLSILLGCGALAGWWLSRHVPAPAQTTDDGSVMLAKVRHEVEVADEKVGRVPPMPVLPPAAAEPVPPGEERPDFAGIAVELVRARELQSLPAAPVEASRAEVAARIARWLETQFPGDAGTREGRALAALGAIPEAVDTRTLRASFWSHQIGAWLEAGGESLLLAGKSEGDGDESRENALGLAFAHLFRDRGSDLFRANGAPLGADAWLARFGLIAGDAAFTRLRHALNHPRTGGGGGVGEDPDDPSHEVAIPSFLRERELAAFGVGMDFVSSLHGLGKFEQVNAAYGRPPVASIELLEPSLYLAETPFRPEMPAEKDAGVDGARPYWDDTLGAISLVLLLKQHVPQPIAAEAVPGWRGDRLLAYAAAGGKRDHAVLQTLWRDGDAADAYFTAMRQALVSRYKTGRVDASAPRGVFQMDGPERFVRLARTHSGRGVLLVDAADPVFTAAAWKKFAPASQ